MKATIDPEGRIALDHDLQAFLGVQPGDDVVLEPRGAELVIKAANGKTGLCYEGTVLLHRGTALPIAAEEAEILEDQGPIRLPPRDVRKVKAKIRAGSHRSLSVTSED
jgi:hypothetical protein